MRYVAGIDIGTGFTKSVIVADDGAGSASIAGRGTTRTGVDLERAARTAFESALDAAHLEPSRVAYVSTTGFGRYSVGFRDIQITEITSGARGAHHVFPESTSVLDVGSQSTRAISLREGGKVRAFKTNDKCAAGSGSFIVRAAKYLEVGVDEVGALALEATNPQPISSVCAVLAESEIINLVSAGVSVEDILRGIYDSLADRAALLLRRAGPIGELTFIGGLAGQAGMVKALEDRLGLRVNVPEHCGHVCALGAALLGLRRLAAVADEDSFTRRKESQETPCQQNF